MSGTPRRRWSPRARSLRRLRYARPDELVRKIGMRQRDQHEYDTANGVHHLRPRPDN